MVRRARAEQLTYVKEMCVYEVEKLSEFMSTAGKPPKTTRWIDVNNGDSQTPNYRSSLLAR